MRRAMNWGLIAVVVFSAAALVVSVTVALQAQSERIAPAAAAPQVTDSPRFTLVASPLGEKRTGVFILDSQTMRLLVYSVDPDGRMLKLLAVRDISHDARLVHYNNERPWPEDIRQRVEAGLETEPK